MYRARGNKRTRMFPTEHLVTSPGLSQPAVNLIAPNPFMAVSRWMLRMTLPTVSGLMLNSSRPSPSLVTPHTIPNAPSESISIPDSGDYSMHGKKEMRHQLLRLCVNVKDLATALVTNRNTWLQRTHFHYRRIAPPACLLEPIPSLEYWCHLDRPDLFAAYAHAYPPTLTLMTII